MILKEKVVNMHSRPGPRGFRPDYIKALAGLERNDWQILQLRTSELMAESKPENQIKDLARDFRAAIPM